MPCTDPSVSFRFERSCYAANSWVRVTDRDFPARDAVVAAYHGDTVYELVATVFGCKASTGGSTCTPLQRT